MNNRSQKLEVRSQTPIKRGFTVVELLVSMGIVSVLLLLITRIFLQVIETRLEAEAVSAISEDARYIYARLAYDINRATEIVVPANPGDSGSTMILNIDGTNYTYSLTDGNLELDNGASVAQLNGVGSEVTAISFTKYGGGEQTQTVRFELSLDSVIQTVSGATSVQIGSTIGIR